MDGWMVGWLDGWMDGWMNGWTDRLMDGWMDGRAQQNHGFYRTTNVIYYLRAV